MSIVYGSIDAAIVHHAPSTDFKCKHCGARRFEHHTQSLNNVGTELLNLWWTCKGCNHMISSAVCANKRVELPSRKQIDALITRRRFLDMTLRDVRDKTGIAISRLSDIERRMSAPTNDEKIALSKVLGEGILDE